MAEFYQPTELDDVPTLPERIAAVLVDNVRSCDVVARYGGEEFVVVLHDTAIDAAEQSAERLRSKVEALGIEHGRNRVVTAGRRGDLAPLATRA